MKGLIILDLDDTLLTAIERYFQYYTEKDKKFVEKKELDIFLRPYLNTFLSFICNHPKLDVAIWSAGTTEWVNHCCEKKEILGKYSSQFKFIWSRPQCQRIKGTYYKPLNIVKEEFPQYSFYLQIDDTYYDLFNIPKELLLIKRFEYGYDMEDDNNLLKITLILKTILDWYLIDGSSVSSRTIELYQGINGKPQEISSYSSSYYLLKCSSN